MRRHPIQISLVLLFLGLAGPSSSEDARTVDDDSWALDGLSRPTPPDLDVLSPIDGFIRAGLPDHLSPASPASRRDLIRRLSVDLHGILPTVDEVLAFEADERDGAWERLVDRYLASPRYGERWARHWMDSVHYAETHGHDEDGIRENAWPYRDYLISSFNSDKPYARFVREQLAGDVLFPASAEAKVATAFLAVGPWDQSSQQGIQDGTLDKQMAQYMDRDDMITTTMSTFVSASVHCARCHDHKFDAISQEDYYSLQAVFAGLDRVDQEFYGDPEAHRAHAELAAERDRLALGEIEASRLLEPELAEAIEDWERALRDGRGVWLTLDPEDVASESGSPFRELEDHSLLFGGAPPERDTYTIAAPVSGELRGLRLEVLAHDSLPVNGPGRAPNGNLHLSEIRVHLQLGDERREVKLVRPSADFDQTGWTIKMTLDGNEASAWGIYPQTGKAHTAVFGFAEPIDAGKAATLVVELRQLHGGSHLIGRPRLAVTRETVVPKPREPLRDSLFAIFAIPEGKRSVAQQRELALIYLREQNRSALEALPSPQKIYAVSANFTASGNFRPSGGSRPVHVLRRGDIRQKIREARPGAVSALPHSSGRFGDVSADEGSRRAALADWIVDHDNPLTWRSIVNRIWHHHFGRGLVPTPNEFGKLGARPSHPELLDWLASEFRDHAGSIKWLHRQILLSETFRQSVLNSDAERIDPANELIARFPIRRLDAETLRDSLLRFGADMDWRMGGPSDRQFHTSKGVHITPVVDYLGFDPARPENRRRSIYRFVFRTVPDPFFRALDCPDASQLTPTRNESVTVGQALAMRHHRFVLYISERLARRVENGDQRKLVGEIFRTLLQRAASPRESELASKYAESHGLANLARWLINLNEFMFVR